MGRNRLDLQHLKVIKDNFDSVFSKLLDQAIEGRLSELDKEVVEEMEKDFSSYLSKLKKLSGIEG